MATTPSALRSREDASAGRTVFEMRRELVDAQVNVLRIYLEKKSVTELLEAVDRLVECADASFREEETQMAPSTPSPDSRHREMHKEVLVQMDLLRREVMDFDRGRILAQLILVDRCLTTHITDAVGVSDSQRLDRVPEHEATAA
jgi:hemerythrin